MQDLRNRLAAYNREKIVLYGFPIDKQSSFLTGTAEAPPRIREALRSDSKNMWSESGLDLGVDGIFFDAGDKRFDPDIDDVAEIEEAAALVAATGAKPFFLGGDHAITYPILRAFSKKYPGLTLLHFDAHPDLYDEFEGNRFSHACGCARVMEDKLVKRLIQVGIRTANGHQREQAKRFGVECLEMRSFRGGEKFGIEGPVYVSFDLDVLDPAIAPGVSHWEPGGMTVRQAIGILHGIEGEIVGADIVEYNPRRDSTGVTGYVAAKILEEIAAKMLDDRSHGVDDRA